MSFYKRYVRRLMETVSAGGEFVAGALDSDDCAPATDDEYTTKSFH
jgi:hypothetical protein